MSVLKTKDIKTSLKRKGFQELNERDHHFYFLHYNGQRTRIKTKISHGEKEIGDHLIASMAKQVNLNKAQFLSLIECPLGIDEYISILRSKGLFLG